MERHDDDARRWARPGAGARPDRREAAAPEHAPSAASPWTRGLQPTRRPDHATGDATGVPVPLPPVDVPPGIAEGAAREPRMWPVAAGVAGIAVFAAIPHWVAPTIALMVSLVGIPIAWGFRRISHGRRRVQYVVIVLTLLLTATLSVVAPILWLQLGVLQPLTVPT